MSQFKKAHKRQVRNRVLVSGPTGKGKTLSALYLAYGMTGDWSKVFVIDTERDSALAYANERSLGVGEFNHASFAPPHKPQALVNMLKGEAFPDGAVVVIDSLSHFWNWTLDYNSELARGKLKGNTYMAWNESGSIWSDMIDYLVSAATFDVICTARSKIGYEQTDEGGTKKVKRLGLDTKLRDGTEYEFLVELSLDGDDGMATVIKKRGGMFPDEKSFRITPEHGKALAAWARSGDALAEPSADAKPTKLDTLQEQGTSVAAAMPAPKTLDEFYAAAAAIGYETQEGKPDRQRVREVLKAAGYETFNIAHVNQYIAALKADNDKRTAEFAAAASN